MRPPALLLALLARLACLVALCCGARAALAAVPEQPVRVVATGGRIAYTFYTPATANTAFRHRSPHVLGGPVAEIQVGFMDWMYTDKTEFANDTNEVTLTHVWLERAATGQVVALTFSGARQLVLPMNSTTPVWLSDPVPSSVWTGARPARDEVFWLHARGTVPSGGRLPVGTPTTFAGARFAAFPPANDPGTIDTPGPIPAISGWSTRTEGLPLVFLGRYAGPGHLAVIGIGDSILHGTGDSANPVPVIAGYGFFNRAALDADGKNAIATFNLTRHGQTAAAWVRSSSQSRQTPFLEYANVVVEEYGTNDLGSGGTGDAAAILGRLETIWSTARARGVQKIVRTLLLPRTSSTDLWATLAGQTPNTGWGDGGKRDTINDGILAALAAKKVDHVLDTLAVLGDPTDDTRWLTNGSARHVTSDGTHVGPEGNRLLGLALRSALLSLTIDDYAAWAAGVPWAGADSSPSADPDRDGHANLLEYALGSDPLALAQAAAAPGPNVRITNIGPGLEMSFPRLRHDLTYRVEASSDLVNWELVAADPGEAGQLVSVTDTVSLATAPRRFLRLRVSER
jgi:lysophospholipase L1-like esterase